MPIKILKFDLIDSTNSFGIKHFEEIEDKTAISALQQTQGKGRFERVWVSENCENIYLSIVLKPQNKTHIANFTQYLSVVNSKVLEKYNVKPEIKWPNDVLVNGKKISGILCEGSLKNNELQGVVLGIGVNLNMSKTLTEKINQPAASLNLETGKKIDREKFLHELLEEFFLNYDKIVEQGFSCFKEDYLKRINFLGKTVYIQQRDGAAKEEFIAKNIDDKGNLVVLTAQNEEKIIYSGDLIL